MFACLYSLSAPVAALVKIAEDFTPRFEVMGPLVMLDVGGLSRLFGSPQDIGEHLRRASGGPVRIALAPTQTAAALLALGRAGLTVVQPGEEPERLTPLPVSLLGELDRLRLVVHDAGVGKGAAVGKGDAWVGKGDACVAPTVSLQPASTHKGPQPPPHVGEMWDALPYFQSTLDRTSEIAVKAHCGGGCGGGGWKHPRDSHAATLTRPRRAMAECEVRSAECGVRVQSAECGVRVPSAKCAAHSARRTQQSALAEIQSLLDTLRRWGVKTFAALAALPPGDVYERLGARGVAWQHLARGEDRNPLVPWVPDDPFEAALELEWPIEGLDPLSFVLGWLLEPLVNRLERADRGAAVLHTHLRLVSKEVHARTLQLPAPMRDPKTLRTLMLLDLESTPPSAAIDQVRVLVEPTPARVTQWMLFERAQPSPEQVSTLLARLTALMGETHVGSPRLVDSWKPGAFVMGAFQVRSAECGVRSASAECGVRSPVPCAEDEVPGARCPVPGALEGAGHPVRAPGTGHSAPTSALRTPHSDSALRTPHSDSALRTPHSAFRRFRLPVPARVQVQEGRPVRVMTDRRGVTGGHVVRAAGPWRTSGEWWNDAPHPSHLSHLSHPSHPTHLSHPSCWDRDEWDVAIADGTVYRLYVEREVGQWFLEGIVD